MNNVVLIGRIVRDIDVKTTDSGKSIARYTLAVQRDFKNANGEKEADFLSCVCFGKTAEFAERYLKKGSKIAIQGSLRTGSYEKDGVKHYTTDVIVDKHEFCDSKGSNSDNKSDDVLSGFSAVEDDDDDLPF